MWRCSFSYAGSQHTVLLLRLPSYLLAHVKNVAQKWGHAGIYMECRAPQESCCL